VYNIKEKYGILDKDTYNFNEIGFIIGIIRTSIVITVIERQSRPKSVQPRNRKWATMIQGVGVKGYTIPPFIILTAQYHLSTWYTDAILYN
jgi:hypothetical protein